ncbi:hypothetical protein [Scytonema sp. NUACC26]
MVTNSTLVIVADCWEDVGVLLFDVSCIMASLGDAFIYLVSG